MILFFVTFIYTNLKRILKVSYALAKYIMTWYIIQKIY